VTALSDLFAEAMEGRIAALADTVVFWGLDLDAGPGQVIGESVPAMARLFSTWLLWSVGCRALHLRDFALESFLDEEEKLIGIDRFTLLAVKPGQEAIVEIKEAAMLALDQFDLPSVLGDVRERFSEANGQGG
jgi:hypothetical protein